jgi:hypothetical protein
MTEQQTVQRAQEASLVLDNPAYQEAMGQLKEAVVQQWKDCPVRDREGQLLLLQLAKLTDKFEAILKGMIETGKLAQHRIDLDRERNESLAKRFLRKVA